MVRSLLRVVLVLLVVAAIAAFFVGYRMADRNRSSRSSEPNAAGTTGTFDVDQARDAGAAIGGQLAIGANRAQDFARDAALTAKIKSKMALDDKIDASAINVDTSGGIVQLKGSVKSTAEDERAVRLASETDGVASVVDQLTIR